MSGAASSRRSSDSSATSISRRRRRRRHSRVAAERWPRDGMPPNPGAWLTITARNRAIDRVRRNAALAEKTKLPEAQQAVEATMEGPGA